MYYASTDTFGISSPKLVFSISFKCFQAYTSIHIDQFDSLSTTCINCLSYSTLLYVFIHLGGVIILTTVQHRQLNDGWKKVQQGSW